jgi:hypothetical protein
MKFSLVRTKVWVDDFRDLPSFKAILWFVVSCSSVNLKTAKKVFSFAFLVILI